MENTIRELTEAINKMNGGIDWAAAISAACSVVSLIAIAILLTLYILPKFLTANLLIFQSRHVKIAFMKAYWIVSLVTPLYVAFH